MSRLRKKYSNGQSRGDGYKPQVRGSYHKDYHRQCVAFFGSEMAYQKYVEGGRRGYRKSE